VQSQFAVLFEEHSLIELNLEAPTAKFTMFETLKNVALRLQKIEVSRVEQPGHWERLTVRKSVFQN